MIARIWNLPMLKSGQAVTDDDGMAEIVFVSQFNDKDYGISLCAEKENCRLSFDKKTKKGFSITAVNQAGEALKNLAIDWLCLPYHNIEEQ